jgi:predicted ribonuclease YlaK
MHRAKVKIKPILFVDGISIIISYPLLDNFQNYFNDVFTISNRYPKANKLILNFDKTNIIQFLMQRTCDYINNGYENTKTEQLISWITNSQSHQVAKHTECTTPSVSSAHFVMKTVISLTKTHKLKWIYLAFFYSIMSYKIIFCVTSTTIKLMSKRE